MTAYTDCYPKGQWTKEVRHHRCCKLPLWHSVLGRPPMALESHLFY